MQCYRGLRAKPRVRAKIYTDLSRLTRTYYAISYNNNNNIIKKYIINAFTGCISRGHKGC